MKKLLILILTGLLFFEPAFAQVTSIPSNQLPRGAYPGTNTNSAAAAGNIGEYVETVKLIGAGVSLLTNTSTTIVSISLTAGDWDVNGIGYFSNPGTTSYTAWVCSLSLTTNNLDLTPGRFTETISPAIVPGANSFTQAIPDYRFSLSSTTSIFLVCLDTHTVSTSNGYGIIRARRTN